MGFTNRLWKENDDYTHANPSAGDDIALQDLGQDADYDKLMFGNEPHQPTSPLGPTSEVRNPLFVDDEYSTLQRKESRPNGVLPSSQMVKSPAERQEDVADSDYDRLHDLPKNTLGIAGNLGHLSRPSEQVGEEAADSTYSRLNDTNRSTKFADRHSHRKSSANRELPVPPDAESSQSNPYSRLGGPVPSPTEPLTEHPGVSDTSKPDNDYDYASVDDYRAAHAQAKASSTESGSEGKFVQSSKGQYEDVEVDADPTEDPNYSRIPARQTSQRPESMPVFSSQDNFEQEAEE